MISATNFRPQSTKSKLKRIDMNQDTERNKLFADALNEMDASDEDQYRSGPRGQGICAYQLVCLASQEI